MMDFINGGKLPPQNLDAELTLVGQCFEPNRFIRVAHNLTHEMFMDIRYRAIWKAMETLTASGKPITLIEVTTELRRTKDLDMVGGPYFVATCASSASFYDPPEFLAQHIRQAFIAREAIWIQSNSIKDLYSNSEEPRTIISNALTLLARSLLLGEEALDYSAHDHAEAALKHIKTLFESPNTLPGIPTGYKDLDECLGGLQKSRFIILAGRPGMGKTALVLNLCRNIAAKSSDVTIMFFSLEMSTQQLMNRLLSMISGIDSEKINKNRLLPSDIDILSNAVESMRHWNLIIDDTPSISISKLSAKAKAKNQESPVSLIIVDYIQLMEGDKGGNRDTEVSSVSRGLKALGKDLDCPVIALSQLNRDVETRGGDKRPQLRDLRESGSLEQDADIVGFAYRPEYYGIKEDEKGDSLVGAFYVIIQKNRDGALQHVRLKWIAERTTITDWYIEAENKPLSALPEALDFYDNKQFTNDEDPF